MAKNARTAAKTPTKAPKTAQKARKGAKAPAPPTIQPAAQPGSKIAQLLTLLKGTSGVTIAAAAKALHWQTHSVRGAISGIVRKKLSLPVERLTGEGPARYRIATKA